MDPLCRKNNQGFPAWATQGTPRALPVGGEGVREDFGVPVQMYQSPGMGSMPTWGNQSTQSAALGGARAGHSAGGWGRSGGPIGGSGAAAAAGDGSGMMRLRYLLYGAKLLVDRCRGFVGIGRRGEGTWEPDLTSCKRRILESNALRLWAGSAAVGCTNVSRRTKPCCGLKVAVHGFLALAHASLRQRGALDFVAFPARSLPAMRGLWGDSGI